MVEIENPRKDDSYENHHCSGFDAKIENFHVPFVLLKVELALCMGKRTCDGYSSFAVSGNLPDVLQENLNGACLPLAIGCLFPCVEGLEILTFCYLSLKMYLFDLLSKFLHIP